ncbi:MAG: molybdopterin-guanine dinucleotide biosynthesis protein B [Gallionella sp.]|nr:molybdopterin-guanine dinucleotide biosynthesis protein B [Gallionella sp.]MDD4946554.1 molybdopterin-guanine dinucleotide biosynthesis protein B [Gallionella sp.]MDD5613110.1 molybdopterin-guanine dinucleotide biosynthesis protein B [Gallionella sp.]
MKVVAVVGYSGSGKTTLIEKLLPVLTAEGIRVATLKHTHHRVALDTPGKDSWRFKQAGAVASMLVTPSAMQLIADIIEESDPVRLAERYFADADLVLAESFSHADCPKIEVWRAACSATPRCTDGVIAQVTDVATADPHLPQFALDDIAGIARFLMAQLK